MRLFIVLVGFLMECSGIWLEGFSWLLFYFCRCRVECVHHRRHGVTDQAEDTVALGEANLGF